MGYERAVDISVIVAATEGWACLEKCLNALISQKGGVSVEIIVATALGEQLSGPIRQRFPDVQLLAVAPESKPLMTTTGSPQAMGVPELRALAISQANGKVIALTEDHCIPPADWLQQIWDAHLTNSCAAIGGTVENGANKSLLDWAVFYTEYGSFVSPLKDGPVTVLPGPNVSYKREALAALGPSIKERFWDWIVHESLRGRGETLWHDSSISMVHKMHFRLMDYLKERYEYSVEFARLRAFNDDMTLLRFLSLPLLPPLLVARITATVIARDGHRLRFLTCIPYILLFVAVWTIGEMAGYLSVGNTTARAKTT